MSNFGREHNGPSVDCYGLPGNAKLNYEYGGYCYESAQTTNDDQGKMAYQQKWHAVLHTLGVDFSIPENNDMHKQFSAQYELHAEQNAIVEAAKNGIALNGSILYTTVEPCDYCRKLIAQSGIKKVFYRYKYDRNNKESDLIAEKLGLIIKQIQEVF